MSDGGNLPIGPGIWGFIAFFVLALALWFLVRNMNSRLRRMAYRDRDRAEQFAADADGVGMKADRQTPGTPTPETDHDRHTSGASDDSGDDSGDDSRPTDEPPRP